MKDYDKQPVDWLGLLCFVAVLLVFFDMLHLILVEAKIIS